MLEERILQVSLFLPEDVHHRNRVMEHTQGDVLGGDGGEDGRLGLLAADQRQGPYVIQMGMGDENGFQLFCDCPVIGQALLPVFFRMEARIQKERHSFDLQE